MQKTVILVGHKKRQGKDTFAEMLGYPVLHFADPVKEELAAMHGITLGQLDFAKNCGRIWAFLKYRKLVFLVVNFRDAVRQHAESVKSSAGSNVWAQRAADIIQEMPHRTVVVADFRFMAEYLWMKTMFNVVTVKVSRPGQPSDLDQSETELDGFQFDHVIHNNGRLWELLWRANKFSRRMISEQN